jgi:hypothetical protein
MSALNTLATEVSSWSRARPLLLLILMEPMRLPAPCTSEARSTLTGLLPRVPLQLPLMRPGAMLMLGEMSVSADSGLKLAGIWAGGSTHGISAWRGAGDHIQVDGGAHQ